MPKIKTKREFSIYIQDFIDYYKLKELSIKTIKSYYQTLTLFSKYLEEEKNISRVDEVDKNIVEEYLEFTKERGKYSYVANSKSLEINFQQNRRDLGKEVSPVTINCYLRNIKVFFNWLEENQVINKNTVSKVKFLKVKRKAKDQITDDEWKALIKAMDLTKFHEYRDYIITNLILDTGMRVTECINLTINDVDIDRRSILIPAEINKGKRDRVVFYSPIMSKMLQKWLRFKDSMQSSDLLFPTQRTNSVLTAPNFERNFRVYLSRVGLDKNVTPHSLRNNFARRFLIASKGDIYTLSRLLGHSSVTVTEKAYLDLSDEDLRNAYQKYSPLENIKKW